MKGSPGAVLVVALGVFVIVLGYTGKFNDVWNALKGAPAAASGGNKKPSGGGNTGGGNTGGGNTGGNTGGGNTGGGNTGGGNTGGSGNNHPPPTQRCSGPRIITGGVYFIPAHTPSDCCTGETPIQKEVNGQTQYGCSYGSFLTQAERQGWRLFIGAGEAMPDAYPYLGWISHPTGAIGLAPQPNWVP